VLVLISAVTILERQARAGIVVSQARAGLWCRGREVSWAQVESWCRGRAGSKCRGREWGSSSPSQASEDYRQSRSRSPRPRVEVSS
jgi:hypothetical protein